jgi:outer membrane receptor protein involved in Fe transport
MRPAEGSNEASSAHLTGFFPKLFHQINRRLESAMRLDRSELSKAVQTALSLGAVAAVGVAGTAFAQNAAPSQNDQKQPQTLQTIVVTGSHIRRVDLETSNPVVAVTAQQIAQTGKLTLGDVVQQLPVITGGVERPTVNNGGGSGQTLVGLRGLGASRTLVLVDGQRVINNDLNSIPAAAVERIEVLTDGASSVYGSDAIGGVINIILKSNYQGAQFSLNYGISDHDDGERKGASFMFGQTSDKGSILMGVDYNKFDPILQSARKFSKDALSLTATNTDGSSVALPGSGVVALVGGSSYSARTRIGVPDSINPTGTSCNLSLNQSAMTNTDAKVSINDYHCFASQPGDKYNYAAVNYLLTPQERTNMFVRGVYHLTDSIDAYATMYHNKTSAGAQLAPAVMGTTTGMSISADSYYNPFGVDFTPKTNRLMLRAFPGGNRTTRTAASTDQLNFGFRGNVNVLSRDWTWDVGMNYGHFSDTGTTGGLPNSNMLQAGVGPSFLNADGVVQCGHDATDAIPLSQCTPWNIFNLNSPSAAKALQAASAAALTNTWDIERIYHADISGGLFDLPAGTVQLAGGVSYRKEYTNNVVSPLLLLDPTTGTCTLQSQCSAHLQGGYNVKEAYAEVFIPVLKDIPFIHALNVTLGDRYSKYSTFGSTNNWKIGVEYRPIEDLLLRGTVSTVFRAPTIGDVFGAPISSAPLLTSDPCDHATSPNPACVGVPLNGTFVNSDVAAHQQIQALTSGSAYAGFPLGPESGKSFDFGAVYSPHFVPGLSVSADIWRIYLNNVIAGVGAQTVLNLCYAGVSAYCPMITRFQSGSQQGQIFQILQPTANLGRLDVKGVDMAANYKLPAFAFGQFNVGVQATYMKQFKIQTAPGQPGNNALNAVGMMGSTGSPLQSSCPFSAGAICFFPRIRAQGTLGWQLGPWDAQWTMMYSSKFKVGSQDISQGQTAVPAFTPTGPAGPYILKYGQYVYNNVTVGYNIQPINTRIDVGVDNVFDKQPPMLYANNSQNANTDPNDFDVIGRYYWARLTVKF